jgi:enamine deaminase RidA (YjgF/YER057c/UK114 family)
MREMDLTMTEDTAVSTPSKLSSLDELLPAPPLPIGSYVATIQVENLVHTSGVLPMRDGQVAFTGAVGSWEVSVEQGQAAARLCVLNALSLLKHTLGSLDRVKRIVKVTGFVSSAASFYDQPQVMNAASDLLVEYFGESGKHVRSAVGVISLPRNASVEVELTVEVYP